MRDIVVFFTIPSCSPKSFECDIYPQKNAIFVPINAAVLCQGKRDFEDKHTVTHVFPLFEKLTPTIKEDAWNTHAVALTGRFL